LRTDLHTTREDFMNVQVRTGWDRLQDLLEGLRAGDELHIGDAVQRSGLDPRTCESVLESLTSMDFFTRSGDHVFVRRPQETSKNDN
jgi:hypothetical protein